MLMIVLFHSCTHDVFTFPHDVITSGRLWYQFVLMLGLIGNNIFVLISGYFLIKSPGINFRRMFNLWIRVVFYAFSLWLVLTFAGTSEFSVKSMLKCFMPITQRRWWFISTYFLMYLIHPYLNIFLHAMTHNEYKKFLLAIGLYWSIIPVLTKTKFGYSELAMFVCLYSLAAYLRLWGKDIGNRKFILYGLAFMGLNFISAVLLDIAGLRFSYAGENAEYFLFGGRPGMMRPFNILSALCLFIGFLRLNVRYSRLINIIASATVGVYMIHENSLSVYVLWHKIFRFPSFQDSPYLIPYSIFAVIIVYIFCTVIELIRSRIFKALTRGKLS